MAKQRTEVSGSLRVLFGVFKACCILVGLPVTMICLMASIGAFTENAWIRVIVATILALGLPLLIVDRMLPEKSDEKSRGLPTDVLAVIWVAFPLIFITLAHGATSGLLTTEADRLGESGMNRIASAAYWLAAKKPQRLKAIPTATKPQKHKAPQKSSPPKLKKDAGPKGDAKVVVAKKTEPDAGVKTPTKLTPAELFQKWAPSVVSISVEKRGRSGSGTGFVIDKKGTIATNSHVIHGASKVKLKLKDGKLIKKVDLLMENEQADLALLKIDTKDLPASVIMGDSSKVKVGEKVIAIGNPLGLEHTLTDGLISSRRIYRERKWIQISVPISPGNSGGPLFNMKGEVIGVTTAGFSIWTGAQNLNLAVPINELKKQIKSKYPSRRSVGTAKPRTW